MRAALTALLAAVTLALTACRQQPAPPTPRLVGAAEPVGGSAPREDALGIGGSGAIEAEAREESAGPQDEDAPLTPDE